MVIVLNFTQRRNKGTQIIEMDTFQVNRFFGIEIISSNKADASVNLSDPPPDLLRSLPSHHHALCCYAAVLEFCGCIDFGGKL